MISFTVTSSPATARSCLVEQLEKLIEADTPNARGAPGYAPTPGARRPAARQAKGPSRTLDKAEFLRGSGATPEPGQIAYRATDDGYEAIRIESVSADGKTVSGVSLKDGTPIDDTSVARLSRTSRADSASGSRAFANINRNFDQGEAIRFTERGPDGELIEHTGTFVGYSEKGYLKIVNADGKRVGVYPEYINDGSIKKLEIKGSQTIQPRYYDEPPYDMEVRVSSADPRVRAQVDSWNQRLINSGVTPEMPKNRSTLEKLEEVWRKDLVQDVASNETRRSYGDARNGLAVKDESGARVLNLGDTFEGECAVCLEQSLGLHRLLAEQGFVSEVVSGEVFGGGHVWLEVFDKRGNSLGIIDSNNTKSLHRNMDEYRKALAARYGKPVSPDAATIDHRQVLMEPAQVQWQSTN